MIPAWQAHGNLSMISESTNNCEGQVNGAARLLGVPKSTLQYRLKKYALNPVDFAGQ